VLSDERHPLITAPLTSQKIEVGKIRFVMESQSLLGFFGGTRIGATSAPAPIRSCGLECVGGS
jgi:hypothetical protein